MVEGWSGLEKWDRNGVIPLLMVERRWAAVAGERAVEVVALGGRRFWAVGGRRWSGRWGGLAVDFG